MSFFSVSLSLANYLYNYASNQSKSPSCSWQKNCHKCVCTQIDAARRVFRGGRHLVSKMDGRHYATTRCPCQEEKIDTDDKAAKRSRKNDSFFQLTSVC